MQSRYGDVGRSGEDDQACVSPGEEVGLDTRDSAGIIVDSGSHHNQITGNDFSHGGDGVFIVDCLPPGSRVDAPHVLRHWDAATGQFRTLATLDMGRSGLIMGLSASPDGSSVLYSRYTVASDLMMVDNFR